MKVMCDFNDYRIARVAEVLADFRSLQHRIAAVGTHAPSDADYFTPAWALLRQCALDGLHILGCAADLSSSVPGTATRPHMDGQEEQRLELLHLLLDAYSRRHEAHKIHLRQLAAQRCILARRQILHGPNPAGQQQYLHACDLRMHQETQQITDELTYMQLLSSDQRHGRWTMEDPGLFDIINWLRTRK